MSWRKRSNIMLCQPMDDKNLERIFEDAGCMLCQPKLDGERAWVIATHAMELPELVSSTGRCIQSVPHVQRALAYFLSLTGRPFPLDGELYIHNKPFEYISSIVSRTATLHADYSAISYHIFDLKTQEPQATRLIKLAEAYGKWQDNVDPIFKDVIKVVPFRLAETIEEVHNYYTEFISAGYEGIVVRHPKAPYKDGRPWYVLKFKPKKRDTYNFVQFDEAVSTGGHDLGRVGAIVCSDAEGNTFRVGPGVGYSLHNLKEMWRQNRGYSKARVIVEYQNLTHTGGVPRFGKFVEIINETS